MLNENLGWENLWTWVQGFGVLMILYCIDIYQSGISKPLLKGGGGFGQPYINYIRGTFRNSLNYTSVVSKTKRGVLQLVSSTFKLFLFLSKRTR